MSCTTTALLLGTFPAFPAAPDASLIWEAAHAAKNQQHKGAAERAVACAMASSSGAREAHARQGCRPVLMLKVRGGLNNQKECLINAGIVAHLLNVTLALPHLDLIGSGNEKFEPSTAAYIGPYSDRSRWGHFGHLFNTSQLVSTFRGSHQLSLVHRVRSTVGRGVKLNAVQLPPVENLTNGCTGYPRLHDTCEALPGDASLLELLVRSWRPRIAAECSARAHAISSGTGGTVVSSIDSARARVGGSGGSGGSGGGGGSGIDGTIVFTAGQSLCWNAYKSRHATECARRYPICAQMLRALSWSRLISRVQQRVLRGVEQARWSATSNVTTGTLTRATQPSSASATAWAAVHVRAFVCEQNKREPSFAHVANALARLGIRSGLLYVVSSVPVKQVQKALPAFTVVGKSTFLGADVRNKYPFEVLAAIDYGVAVQAPLYLGEPRASSFDAFADEERRQRGLMVDQIASTCEASGSAS
jgi:hypothetical protein